MERGDREGLPFLLVPALPWPKTEGANGWDDQGVKETRMRAKTAAGYITISFLVSEICKL